MDSKIWDLVEGCNGANVNKDSLIAVLNKCREEQRGTIIWEGSLFDGSMKEMEFWKAGQKVTG
jgi:hypothetical protein